MHRLSPREAFSSEVQLLCACCRVRPSVVDMKLQASLARLIRPDRLIAAATRHRVAPLLWHNLKQHGAGVIPGDVLDALATRVRRNAVKSLRALYLNVQLARLLRAHGIRFLPLKGVTMAQRYYGEASLRQANDIDFWVPAQSVRMVRDLLVEQGCRPDDEEGFEAVAERGKRHRSFLCGYFHHDCLVHPGGEYLEMHWRLPDNAKGLLLDAADLLTSGESIDVAGESMTMIAPVPQLLYLCEHGARHGWYRLKWLMDLPQVLESREWDWPRVLAEARRANCLAALLLGLKLAQSLFGWDVPEPVATAMKRRRFLNWQEKMVYRNLEKSEGALAKASVMHVLYRLSLGESFGFVWEELSIHFLSPNDLRVVRLPDRWFVVYYGLRPLLFIWRRLFKRERIPSAP